VRVLLQRAKHGTVTVAGETVGRIDGGLVLLTGVSAEDDEAVIAKMAAKVANLRIFNDAEGKFNLSLLDVGGGALVISQFTLYADARKGRRPSFTQAARPEIAEPLIARFVEALRREGVARVETGSFGAEMDVALCNHGPVTIWLDSAEWSRG